MQKIRLTPFIALLAFLVLGLGNVQAQRAFKARLKLQFQGSFTTNLTSYHYAVSNMTITDEHLLKMLETAYNTNFPAGSKLVSGGVTYFQVVDDKGNVIIPNTYQYLRFGSLGNYLYQKTGNSALGSYAVKYIFTISVIFSDGAHGNSLNFNGYATFKEFYIGRLGLVTSINWKIAGAGSGIYDGYPFIARGIMAGNEK